MKETKRKKILNRYSTYGIEGESKGSPSVTITLYDNGEVEIEADVGLQHTWARFICSKEWLLWFLGEKKLVERGR